MSQHLQIVATVASVTLLLIVLELVRQRRLFERYAILWMVSTLVLLTLSVWSGLLGTAADAIGIAYPPSALFLIALGFVLVLLLHFSVAVSRLSDQTKVLAQRQALLEERLRQQEAGAHASGAAQPPAAVEASALGDPQEARPPASATRR